MADTTTPAAQPYQTVVAPNAVTHWVLQGPAGFYTDQLLALCIGAGCVAEAIEPGTTYRVSGRADLLDAMGAELAPIPGYSMQREQPPTNRVHLSNMMVPRQPYLRTTVVHGAGSGYSFAARAVDRGLRVAPAGIGRFAVTGSSAVQMAWLASTQGVPLADVLAQWNTTADAIKAEDSTVAPTVNVNLPIRVNESTITRDASGNIVSVIQRERDGNDD